jgi:tetratricopeptide (TPR) repeat protein
MMSALHEVRRVQTVSRWLNELRHSGDGDGLSNMNKYLIAGIGLAVGFAISFFWTQSFNKNNATTSATAASSGAQGGMQGAGGAGGQQAMMGQVQQTIDKAKNNPNDFQAQVEAATIFNKVGRQAETVEYLKKAYAIDPNKFNELGAAGFLGQYYFDQKDYAESETWFNRAIKAEPNEAELYVGLAETYVQREPPQPDQAIAQLQQALKVDAKNGHALGHLVEAYALKKDARAAEETLKQLKQADPTNQRLSTLETMVADVKAGKRVTLPKE